MSSTLNTANALASANALQIAVFMVFPYIAMAVCLIGGWARFDLSQYSVKSGSSQMLRKKNMRLASNLFHIGILGILGGHFVGLLTPHWVYEPFISAWNKQIVAVVAGGFMGMLCWIGLTMLIFRRFTDERISHTSSFSDKFVLLVLYAQLNMGLISIFFSLSHGTGNADTMLNLSAYIQSIVTFQPIQAISYIPGTDLIFQMHLTMGFFIIMIFPFTRLMHIITAPMFYIGRSYQVVRQKKFAN